MDRPSFRRLRARVPMGLKQALAVLSGTALAQIVPALLSPLLTRLYMPADFGGFALMLALFGVLAPITCLRYDLAIAIPEQEDEAARLTLVSLVSSFAMTLFVTFAGAGILTFHIFPRAQDYLTAIVLFLPPSVLIYGVLLIAQNWAIRSHDFRRLSLAAFTQAAVATGIQIGLGLAFGSNVYFLISGNLFGLIAATIVFQEPLRNMIWPRIVPHLRAKEIMASAWSYLRFPLYTGPYAFAAQASVRAVFVILAALATAATVGQYGLAQRVIFLPVATITAAANQVFFSRATRQLNTLRMERMVRLALVVGPVILGPIFMLGFLFTEPLFAVIFGPRWQEAGRFAVILIVPSLVKTMTVWLDRIYDITGRQRLAMTIEIAYGAVAIATMYLAMRLTGSSELGLVAYATVNTLYFVIWLTCTLAVAGYRLRIAAEFVFSTTITCITVLAIDRTISFAGIPFTGRIALDIAAACGVTGCGIWLAMQGPARLLAQTHSARSSGRRRSP